MFHILLECNGIPVEAGAQAAADIEEEFTHRPWHRNVRCDWDGSRLRLQASNDFDANGLALLDEFSDAICACIVDAQYYDLRVVEIQPLADNSPRNGD